MRDEDRYIGRPTVFHCFPGDRASAICECECEPCCRSRWLPWPPDLITRLVMDADRVSENALAALLQRIAMERSARSFGPCDFTRPI
jgi:hypothetical protein